MLALLAGTSLLAACTFQVSIEPAGQAHNARQAAAAAPPVDALVATAVQATLQAMPSAPASSDLTAGPGLAPPDLPGLPERLIFGFEVRPSEVAPGEPVTISWSFGGDYGRICAFNPAGEIEECWDIPGAGAREVITNPQARNEITFVLYVYSDTRVEEASRVVTLRCPDTWFMANPPAKCPISPASSGYAVSQQFERGLMIELNGQIYVLFNQADIIGGQYVVVENPWQAGRPEVSVNPPRGFYEPVWGFGMLWRGELDPDLYGDLAVNIRSRVGWASAPAFGYTASYQCDSTAIPSYRACYLQGPDTVVYVLNLGFWEPWNGPPAPRPEGEQR